MLLFPTTKKSFDFGNVDKMENGNRDMDIEKGSNRENKDTVL